jgi:Protein of unknown function (DUF2997)
MELQQIDVFIDRDGAVRLEVSGVKGGSCLDITRHLEAALGNGVVSRELTSEAHEILAQVVGPRLTAARGT